MRKRKNYHMRLNLYVIRRVKIGLFFDQYCFYPERYKKKYEEANMKNRDRFIP